MFAEVAEEKLVVGNILVLPILNWVNQLLSITLEIYHFIDQDYEIQVVFFDTSKVYDKVWHKGLVFKLKKNWDIWQPTKYFRRFSKK